MIKWISESEGLPLIAQEVLLLVPSQTGDFWRVVVARLLVNHEGVVPKPITPGDRWATDYRWVIDHYGKDISLVTGNGYWASLKDIPLPPLAEHKHERGYDYISQLPNAFIPKQVNA